MRVAQQLQWHACMGNYALYGSLGAQVGPFTSTLNTIDGSFVLGVGLAVLLTGAVLLSAVIRRRRRVTLRGAVNLRRVAA